MTAEQLIGHADAALYEAKRNGRNTFCCSTPQLQARIAAERSLARDIEEGIVRRDFIPFYQPQFDVETGAIFGVEALVRWRHPERGLLTPAAFITAATEMGKIDQIDRLILEEAAVTVDRLEEMGIDLPAVSVNVSEARLADGQLCDEIERLWREKPCQLTVELLETIDFDDGPCVEHVDEVLQRLRDMDIKIETDDFGSGRASITGLLRIAPDRVKVDRSLIQKVVSSQKQRSLVRGILDMCTALDIECIAEGVETREDLDAMIKLGFQKFQGFVFSKPLPEDALLQFLKTQKLAPRRDHINSNKIVRSA